MKLDRRWLLKKTAFAAATMATPGLLAEQLSLTPRTTEGPFYPDRMPLDTDNDLLILNDSISLAAGEVTHLGGRVLSTSGEPLQNATVEIWQVDNNGVYLHSKSQSGSGRERDPNFQGFGRFLTGSSGDYYFRTIKPTSYPGRPPHIHFAVNHKGRRVLTTQLFVANDRRNSGDGLFRRLGQKQKLVTKEFVRVPSSITGELAVKFDMVLGVTPDDQS